MEPHPIPQNVSSFQFRLVGDMTLRQFLYLAAGAGLGYIVILTLGIIYPLLAWPLGILLALLGIAFAFLPIASRPLDLWLKAFLKAVYSPTKRVWAKKDKTYREDPLFKSRYVTYLSAIQPRAPDRSEYPLDQHPAPTPIIPPRAAGIAPGDARQTPASTLQHPASSPSPLPTSEELQKTVDLAKQAQNLQMQIVQTERALNKIKSEAQKPTPIPVDYSSEVSMILSNLQRLVSEASGIKSQLAAVTQPEEQTKPKPQALPNIVRVSPAKQSLKQIALTTFPNVINGIVKDGSGNYLEGVIAVIHDKEGLPVRALKTNKLGQFMGSTPLPNGIYTLEMEKENYSFDMLQIELTGGVLPPIMITAKQ